MTPDQLRIALLRKGVNPYKEIAPREWNEHQLTFQSHCESKSKHLGLLIVVSYHQ